MIAVLKRDELGCGVSALLVRETSHKMKRAWCVEFFRVGKVDSILQPLAAGENCANANCATVDLDYAARVLKKGPVPASLFQTPGAHKDPAFNHYSRIHATM